MVRIVHSRAGGGGRRVRRHVAVTAAATALLTVLAGAATPQADDASRQNGGAVPVSLGFLPTTATVPAGTVPVTLVTGDRVQVEIGPDGVPVARDIAAARSEERRVGKEAQSWESP